MLGYVGRGNRSSDLMVIDIERYFIIWQREKEMFAGQAQPAASIINVADNLAGFIIVLIDQAYDSVMVWSH